VTEYIEVFVDLVPSVIGDMVIRRKKVDIMVGDVLYIDVVRTTADLSKLWYSVDDLALINANLSLVLDLRPSKFREINVEWTSENDYKTVVFIIGRKASLTIETPRSIFITEERIGLFATDYDLLILDLGLDRRDALVADNVISFCVVEATTGATYEIKLFDPRKSGLGESVLKPGTCIEKLKRAKLYLSNVAQSGAYLKILVLKA